VQLLAVMGVQVAVLMSGSPMPEGKLGTHPVRSQLSRSVTFAPAQFGSTSLHTQSGAVPQ
jgi:hypothetical protein